MATVNNVATINHKNLSGGVVSYNEALYSNVGAENVTMAVAGSTTAITNASAATVFGNSAGAADTMTVAFVPGSTGRTFNVALGGAGSSTAASTVDYVGANTDINKVSVATTGTNNVNLNGTTGVTNVTITGAGNNTISLTGAGALSTTGAVTIDASAAAGNNIIDLGSNITTGGLTVLGSTLVGSTSTTTLGLAVSGIITLPTITNVEGLQLDAGSNGTLITTAGNTSITNLNINDSTVGANTNGYTLTGLSGIGSVVWGVNGGGANQFGGLTLTGSGTLSETFARINGTPVGSTNTLTLGTQNLNGYTGLTINTAGGVGSAAAATVGAINSTTGAGTLQTVQINNSSSANTALNTITSTTAAGAGTVTTLNLSGIAGTTTEATPLIAANTLASGAVVTSSAQGSSITLAGAQANASSVNFVLGSGSNTLAAGALAAAQNATVIATDAATSTNTITTGAGNDSITVGAGTNTINAGAGTNLVTFGTHAAAQVDTLNVTASSSTVLSGLLATDRVAVSGTGLTASVSLGAHSALAAGRLTVANTGAGANSITLNNLVAGDNVGITSAGGAANNLTYGTHAAGVVSTIGTTAVTTNFTGLITGDTVNAAVAAGNIGLGAGHTPVAVNLTAASGAWVIANSAGDTFNVTTAGASSLALGAHTTGDVVNAAGANTLTITNNIAADVINVGFGGTAGNVAVSVGGSSTINANVNAAVVAVTSGTSTINTAAGVSGTYTLGDATHGTTTTFVNADASAQTINSGAAGGFVNVINLGDGTETVVVTRAANNTTLSGLSSVDSVVLSATGTTLNVGSHTGVATVVSNVAASNAEISNFEFGGAGDKLVLDLGGTNYVFTKGAGGDAVVAAGTVGNQITFDASAGTVTLAGATNVVNVIGETYATDADLLADIENGGGAEISLAAVNTVDTYLLITYSDGANLHVVAGFIDTGDTEVTAIVDVATLVGTTTGAANANLLWQA